MPLLFVVTVADPVKVPLAPLPGAANVTDAPFTGLLLSSIAVACSVVANAVPTVALCGVPIVAVIDAAVPALFVKLKLAGVDAPTTLAVTE
jgi:hypothetical protein